MKLHLLTINVHKGFSPLNRRFVLPRIKDAIHSTQADIVFLQEIVGENTRKAAKHYDWPAKPQHEYIANAPIFNHAYGKNAVYAAGHHGNAILSRFRILDSEKMDVSTNMFEKRGILYSRLKIPHHRHPLHCVCVHMGLFHISRKKQFRKLRDYIRRVVPDNEPLIVAGDFNEWRKNKKDELETHLGMKDAGLEIHGRKLKTFPALLPVLPLDRIYLKGFKVLKARILHKGMWKNLSDHAGFSAEVEIPHL
ncbi:MAG: endonuclease/exonuclease/phosphatase family protein [Planctomycetes bacterium]|nr:endonuclease/exonuclease/phosphatase family protein [Planctomycetota bacterium]